MERCINSNYKWSFENGVEALTPTRSVASDMNRHGLIVGGVENNAYDTQSSAGDETLAAYWPPDQENAVQLANNGSGNLTSGNSLIDAVDASGNIMGVKNTLLATTNSSRHFMVSWSGSIANGFETMLGTPNAIEVTRTYPENSNPDPFYYKTMLEGRVFETVGLNQTKGWIGKEKEHFVDPTNININSEGPINFTGFKPSESRYMFETTELDFRPIAINDNGVILGKQSGAYGYSVGDEGFTECVSVSGAVIGLSSPAETSEPLRIITLKGLYQQKAVDPSVEELSYASVTATTEFDYWTTSELVNGRNANATNWTNITGYAISANGDFIAATAINTDGEERSLLLLKVDLAVDADRSGTIDFGNAADKTEEDKPYTFWINNDYDSSDGDDPDGSSPNHSDSVINGIRDLEDFTRLHIDVSAILPMLKDDTLDLALKFENTTGNPEIKLWAARGPDGGVGYLEDETIAEDHLTLGAPGVIGGNTPYVIAQQFWDNLPDGTDTAYLLYEGARVGRGELTLEIQSGGQALGDGPSVWLELRDVKSMYVRGKADWPSNVDYPHEYAYPNVDPPEPNMGYTIDSMGYNFNAPWYETGETIVFVHGWNQPYENSISFGETGFKRLWHRGFTGRYAMFRWPTFVGIFTYNDSDYRAWKSGQPLKQFVQSLPGTKNIMAHSMGNIVTGSALKQGLSVNNYALINAAVPAACYDSNTGLNQWTHTTPDTEAELGFRGYLGNVGGNLINFYLPNDFELWSWTQNNNAFKPQRFNAFTTGYYYDPNEVVRKRLGISFFTRIGRFVNTPHEAMAYVAQSQTKAVGAEGNTAGAIDVSINLATTYCYSDDTEHSGPWNYPIQEIFEFYSDLLVSFGIEAF